MVLSYTSRERIRVRANQSARIGPDARLQVNAPRSDVSLRKKLYHHAVRAFCPLANCAPGNDSSSLDVVNLRPVAAWGKMMFPWFATTMLAMESNHVVGLRLMKFAFGYGTGDEAMLMITEKVAAALEAGATMLTGGTPSLVVARYREHVMANAGRLSSD